MIGGTAANRNGYIGRNPSDSSVVIDKQTFTASGVQTSFTFSSQYTPGFIDAYLNGSRLVHGTDYTATNGSIVNLVSPAQASDLLELVAYKAFNVGNNIIGIQSGGTLVGNVKNLNFVGAGNSVILNGSTIDIQIEGGGGIGGTTGFASFDSNTGISTTKKLLINNDLNVTGVTTSVTFNGSITGTAATFSGPISGDSFSGDTAVFTGNVTIGGTLTYEDVTNIDSVGFITSREGIVVVGGGVSVIAGGLNVTAGVTSIAADLSIADKIIHTGDANTAIRFPDADIVTIETGGTERLRVNSSGISLLTGTITGTATTATNVTVADESSDTSCNVLYTTAATGNLPPKTGTNLTFNSSTGQLNATKFVGDGSALTNLPAAGLTTEAFVVTTNGLVTLNLSSAQDHKVTALGITTITCTGGTETESHTVRIINSGISTVGFSTYFLFPSGSTPVLSTADEAISLISFTVNRVGVAGTQLLAGASVNFS
tara:strand:- start:1748 stop:3205 length:1458 start_codon:yes stop_codon:yes gene_type:complete